MNKTNPSAVGFQRQISPEDLTTHWKHIEHSKRLWCYRTAGGSVTIRCKGLLRCNVERPAERDFVFRRNDGTMMVPSSRWNSRFWKLLQDIGGNTQKIRLKIKKNRTGTKSRMVTSDWSCFLRNMSLCQSRSSGAPLLADAESASAEDKLPATSFVEYHVAESPCPAVVKLVHC